MTCSVTSPVTGTAQNGGFTSPTYTVVSTAAPDVNGKQYVVTALGGTQPGTVKVHTASSPFLVSVWQPKSLQVLGKLNPLTGLYASVPKNRYKVITLKGVIPAVGQPDAVMPIETNLGVPAGADTYDIASVRAAISMHIGVLNQISAGLGDTAASGTI